MRRPAILGARLAGPLAAGLVALGLAGGTLVASDHQDSPFVEFNQRYDVNDVYAFPGATPGRVALVLSTSSPLTPAQKNNVGFGVGGEVLYQLKVDNTGDAVEDLVFQVTFAGTAPNQTVRVVGPIAPPTTGTANTMIVPTPGNSIQGATNAILGSPTGIQVFAGPRDDPFYLDLEYVFRILPNRKPESGPLSQLPREPSASSFRPAGQAIDYLRGLNDLAIVIELPTSMLTANGARPRFGVWGTTSQRRSGASAPSA